MQLVRGYKHNRFNHTPVAATIGNFDGVHIGHQALIRKLKVEAKKRHLPATVILFEPQPGEYFQQDDAPARIYSFREKLCHFANLDIDFVVCMRFDKDLAVTKAEYFANHILFRKLNVRYLLIGEDFNFGYQRLGNYETLCDKAKTYNAEVNCFEDFLFAKKRVSSTIIRQTLRLGDFSAVEKLLGRAYAISGRVIHGAKRGRYWGIPTANIKLTHTPVPLRGVFDVWVIRQNNEKHAAIANMGMRPTVDGSRYFLEAHIHQFDESLYGEWLRVVFLHKRRDEIKFDSVDDLIAQIHQDILDSKTYFSNQSGFDFRE